MSAPAELLDHDTITEARSVLQRGLELEVRRSPRSRQLVRLGAYQLAHGALGSEPPFRWSATTARRTIGLAAIRSCITGAAATPGEAVTLVLADPHGAAHIGPVTRGSCADWLSVLTPPARAYVAAEATTWATRLWTAVDWSQPGATFDVGTSDRWWRWRPEGDRAVRVALRGRADLRIRLTHASHAPSATPRPHAHLSVFDGCPTLPDRRALVLSALVDGLNAGPTGVPLQVIGVWPDCGKVFTTQVTGACLLDTARHSLATVRSLLSLGPGAASSN